MHRMVVLFPDPLGPRKPVTRPGLTSKLRSSTAIVRPKRLVSPLTSIIPGTLVPTICAPARVTSLTRPRALLDESCDALAIVSGTLVPT